MRLIVKSFSSPKQSSIFAPFTQLYNPYRRRKKVNMTVTFRLPPEYLIINKTRKKKKLFLLYVSQNLFVGNQFPRKKNHKKKPKKRKRCSPSIVIAHSIILMSHHIIYPTLMMMVTITKMFVVSIGLSLSLLLLL